MILIQTIRISRIALHADKQGVRPAIVTALIPVLEKIDTRKCLIKYGKQSNLTTCSFNKATLRIYKTQQRKRKKMVASPPLSDERRPLIIRINKSITLTNIATRSFYHIYPTPSLGQDMTQGQFLSGFLQVLIQSFPPARLVASPRLKNPVCPTIYP